MDEHELLPNDDVNGNWYDDDDYFDQLRSELEADAYMDHYDDDPNPYHGTYSEE